MSTRWIRVFEAEIHRSSKRFYLNIPEKIARAYKLKPKDLVVVAIRKADIQDSIWEGLKK